MLACAWVRSDSWAMFMGLHEALYTAVEEEGALGGGPRGAGGRLSHAMVFPVELQRV